MAKENLIEKRTFVSRVIMSDGYSFEDCLLNFKGYVPFNSKDIELSFVEDHLHYITGCFVATQKKGIAPQHKPGVENDYSAIPLGPGKGLAYPNMFLYIKELQVLIWEVNRYGVVESSMSNYFETIATQKTLAGFHCSIFPLLNLNASKRIKNMLRIDSVELQIANPVAYLNQNAAQGALSSVGKLVNETNATKSIGITLKAEPSSGGSLTKSGISSLLGFFASDTPKTVKGRTHDRFIVKGVKNIEDSIVVEETINLVFDRMVGYFKLKNQTIQSDLQIPKRKEGIELVYMKLHSSLKELLSED